MRKSIWIPAAGVLAVALVIGGVVLASSIAYANRSEVFIDSLRSDPQSHVDGLPDEQLLTGLDKTCEQIAAGLTLDAVLANAKRTVAAGMLANSPLTEREYLENVQAIHNASVKACNG